MEDLISINNGNPIKSGNGGDNGEIIDNQHSDNDTEQNLNDNNSNSSSISSSSKEIINSQEEDINKNDITHILKNSTGNLIDIDDLDNFSPPSSSTTQTNPPSINDDDLFGIFINSGTINDKVNQKNGTKEEDIKEEDIKEKDIKEDEEIKEKEERKEIEDNKEHNTTSDEIKEVSEEVPDEIKEEEAAEKEKKEKNELELEKERELEFKFQDVIESVENNNNSDKTSRSNSINSSSSSALNIERIYLLKHPLSISPIISPKVTHSNTTSTTTTNTTTTTTSTSSSSSNNNGSGTPRSSSFVAQPTIAILPEFNLDHHDKSTTSTTSTTTASSSINSSINSSNGGSNFTNPSSVIVEPHSASSTPPSPIQTPPSPNSVNNQNKGGFFNRIFRREQSKTALSSTITTTTTTTTPSTNETPTTANNNNNEGGNSILNKISNISASLQNLPKTTSTNNLNVSPANHKQTTTTTTTTITPTITINNNIETPIPDDLSNSSSTINNSLLRKSKGDFSRLLKENEIYSYENFLSKLENTLPIKSSIDSFIRTLKNRKVANDDLREALLDFVDNMQNTLTLDPQWSKSSSEELNYSSHHLQQYVLEKIYDYVFQPSEEEAKKDSDLSQLIKKLSFITLEHMEIPIYVFSEQMWDKAGKYLSKINFTKSCRHKVMYIMKCCKTILKHFSTHLKEVSGADFLLPNLIWVLLKTNPPFLHSNVIFISKFSDSSDSEAIYYLTQLISAIYFVENIKLEHLKIDKKEYYKLMGTSSPQLSRSPSLTGISNSNNNNNNNNSNNNTSSESSNNSPNIKSNNLTSVLIANDNALATLVEIFPDCDTQYLVECINYIESRHSSSAITQHDLVFRVTNLIAELQGNWQPSPKTKPITNSSGSGNNSKRNSGNHNNHHDENNFVNEQSPTSFKIQENNNNSQDADDDDLILNGNGSDGSNNSEGVENIIESIMNESNKLIVNSNNVVYQKQSSQQQQQQQQQQLQTTAQQSQEIQKLQNLLDKRDEEIQKLQQKTKQDQMEIFELKKNLQIKAKETKSFNNLVNSNSFKIPNVNYQHTRIDDLKVTDIPTLLSEYKTIFNQLKLTNDSLKKLQQQQQQ